MLSNIFYNGELQRVPLGSENSIEFVLNRWSNNMDRIIKIDSVNWPDNKLCAYLKS